MKKTMTVTEFARLGGKARAESLTPEQRSAIAKKAGKAGGKARRKKLLASKMVANKVSPSSRV